MPAPKAVLSYVRPIALRRAVTNLIDNALKYGRRATVSFEADATAIIISVEDEGGLNRAAEMEKFLDPFKRGDKVQSIAGFGLGLTIVTTVARQHGGHITFEDGTHGLRAILTLKRQL